jgi:hypothetical protein
VRLVAVFALDHEPADADGAQQSLVDLEVGQVLQHVLPLRVGQRVELGVLTEVLQARGRISGIAVERVDRLVVLHPSTVVATLLSACAAHAEFSCGSAQVGAEGRTGRWVR